MSDEKCRHELESKPYPLQRNALRVEVAGIEQKRCALKPKKDQFGRRYNVSRYVLSGGPAYAVAHECCGRVSIACPLNVEAEDHLMNDSKSGPCPECRTANTRHGGYGDHKCRRCGAEFTFRP